MVKSEATQGATAAHAAGLPWSDEQDHEDATRGFVGRSDDRRIRTADGRVAWDLDAYAFLSEECPPTANPSLWRQSRLLVHDGLFEVTDGLYQVRGYDVSVVSFIESDNGVIVVDPLISTETAAAALALYRAHRGDRPVVAVVYSHSHADHFGGVRGVTTEQDVAEGKVQVIAPSGFMEHAVGEVLVAGAAMGRRSQYMFGLMLDTSPTGQIGSGLGQRPSAGEAALIPPTVDIDHTGQELVIDGVRLVFQITPGTEAPSEMNFYLPDLRALCMAENTSHTLHNILTIRGAFVRDSRAWADYITESIDLFGGDLDLVFASHHWPTWGRERSVEFLALQRDLYSYLHDQTVRLINQGYVGAEIAETLVLPPAVEAAWHTRGYYGSVSHNVKAIYQRYLGWYDGNPAHLWQHPPVAAAQRYVRAMGGPAAAMALAEAAFAEGDYRWAAEVLDRILFDDETNEKARALQADTFERIGHAQENGTWRNAFLSGAQELRQGVHQRAGGSSAMASAMTIEQLFLSIALRVDGPRAWDEHIVLAWTFTETGRTYLTELRNGTLVHRWCAEPPAGATTLQLTKRALLMLIGGAVDPATAVEKGFVTVEGSVERLERLLAVLTPNNPQFAIVTPRPPLTT
ncbi:alkyl sulfatase dimerization domain-containing protein [Pseudonocardia ailaonensis]|uniref:Alkyl sulfatase dimerization domain-containing protein n=1 Tax=Pseudonocardia ailaonensis TaxID=367279 RepID=A0ABN2NR04_9PSEU